MTGLFIWLAMVSASAAVISVWGFCKIYRADPKPFSPSLKQSASPKQPLKRIPLGLCVLACILSIAAAAWFISRALEPRHYENAGKMWLPVALVVVSVSDQDADTFLEALRKFADERNAAMQTFPKPGQKKVDFRIPVGPESYFKVYNFEWGKRFNIAAYSHDKPSTWTSDWQLLIERLTARLGKEHVQVKQAPPDSNLE